MAAGRIRTDDSRLSLQGSHGTEACEGIPIIFQENFGITCKTKWSFMSFALEAKLRLSKKKNYPVDDFWTLRNANVTTFAKLYWAEMKVLKI